MAGRHERLSSQRLSRACPPDFRRQDRCRRKRSREDCKAVLPVRFKAGAGWNCHSSQNNLCHITNNPALLPRSYLYRTPAVQFPTYILFSPSLNEKLFKRRRPQANSQSGSSQCRAFDTPTRASPPRLLELGAPAPIPLPPFAIFPLM